MDKKTMIVAFAFLSLTSISVFADQQGGPQPDQYDDQGPVEEQGPPPQAALPPVYPAPVTNAPPCEDFLFGGPLFNSPLPPYCAQFGQPGVPAPVPCEAFLPGNELYGQPLPPYCGQFGQVGFVAPVLPCDTFGPAGPLAGAVPPPYCVGQAVYGGVILGGQPVAWGARPLGWGYGYRPVVALRRAPGFVGGRGFVQARGFAVPMGVNRGVVARGVVPGRGFVRR